MHEVLHQMATQHQEFRDKTMSAVVLPLQAFHKESEEKRKELLEEMARLSKLNKQVFDTMKKSKKKAFELLEHMRAERDKEKGGAPVRKQTDKAGGNWMSKMASAIKSVAADSPEQLREKAAQACAAYKEAVDVSNARQKLFHERELPRLMEEMQQLELARLDVLRDHLTKFAVIFHDCVTPLEELANRCVRAPRTPPSPSPSPSLSPRKLTRSPGWCTTSPRWTGSRTLTSSSTTRQARARAHTHTRPPSRRADPTRVHHARPRSRSSRFTARRPK